MLAGPQPTPGCPNCVPRWPLRGVGLLGGRLCPARRRGTPRGMNAERKAPEYPAEHVPEATGMRWIPIAEVEVLIGKRERNARYWLERHAIPARGERPRLFAEAAIVAKLAELRQTHR